MSVSAGLHCSTSATMLSWPANTWQSCSLRLAVSSWLLSAPEAPNCLCWCPTSHPFPCPLALPRLPPPAASRAPPRVLSRKFRTSVWERGGLEEGKVVATQAKEWFPGSGVLRWNTEIRTQHYMELFSYDILNLDPHRNQTNIWSTFSQPPCRKSSKAKLNSKSKCVSPLIPVLWA